MSAITSLLWKIRQAEAHIAEGEQYIQSHQNDAAMLVNLRSAVRLRDALQRDLDSYCNKEHFDVVRYEVPLRDTNRTQLRAREFGAMLVNFQNLLGATTQALVTNKPVDRFDAFPEVSATFLNWGYQTQADDGTLGFVFVGDSEELISSVPVDEAIAQVSEMLAVKKPDELISFSDKFGKSTIRHLHGWVEAHTHAHAGLRLQWRHRKQIEFEQTAPEWVQLSQFINEATKSEWEDTEVTGELIGIDIERRWFAMRATHSTVITGRFKRGVISVEKRAELPRLYQAVVRKRTKTWLATGRMQEAYELLELRSP